MTVIERTAYPRFKQHPSALELAELYTPTPEEIKFVKSRVKSHAGLLGFTIVLKSFQRLGYFPHPELVPAAVINHLRSCLKLQKWVKPIPSKRSQQHYQQAIREYLGVKPYDKAAQKLAAMVIASSARVRNHPADLLNVAIEELVKERYELPAFSTLDRLVDRVRTITNTRLFGRVSASLSPTEQVYLDRLLVKETDESVATLNLLKSPPKSATLSHMQQLQAKFNSLMSFGDAKRLLSAIAPTKIKSWAAQAKALDISEFQDIKLSKRRTLLLCLLYQAQVKTRHDLVEMFLKRIHTIHNHARTRLLELREKHLAQTEALLGVLAEILIVSAESQDNAILGQQVQLVLDSHGGWETLQQQCEEIAAYNSNNHLPLLWQFYSRHRKQLFALVRSVEIRSTTADESLIAALTFVLENEHRRTKWLKADLDLSFATYQWRSLVVSYQGNSKVLVRQQLEICIFTYLATELKTGDACVVGSENYADFREQLLSSTECERQLAAYCNELGFPATPEDFVNYLRLHLTQVAAEVDKICFDGKQVTIGKDGEPVLKRIPPQEKPEGTDEFVAAILQRIPESSILDVLCNVEHWLNWTRHFGPLAGTEPKMKGANVRYILTTFGYGCNLGPNQTARHTRGRVTSHMVSYTNRRHISIQNLEASIRDIINAYSRFNLPKLWGTGKAAAADGSKFEIYENNLMTEYHIRYGGYGGIAYHHVSDTYIALFTHFITCGVWEAVYILDGLLKNTSELQPDTLHADTQGQSTPVFALSYLLGIKLMPRIRNWQDYTFFRPSAEAIYKYIDPLFKDVVDWKLIQTHWHDMMRVVLSIKAGKLMPSTFLRKLGSYSRKNRLYQGFRELGQVVRTIFLLQYISDRGLRQQITACTNKVEDYHRFLDWLFFGKDGVITENDPVEQEKRLKYLDLVASAVILQNTFDMSLAIQALSAEGYPISHKALATLSPYITRHLKRYGDYVVDLQKIPQPLEGAFALPSEIAQS